MSLVYHKREVASAKCYSRTMSLHLKQQDTRSDMQKRIAAELQEKAKRKASEADLPDGVDDSRYIEGTKQTTTLAWAWILIFIAIVAIIIWLFIATQ